MVNGLSPGDCRLDTAEEVSVYVAGGVLQRFARDFWLATLQQRERNMSLVRNEKCLQPICVGNQ